MDTGDQAIIITGSSGRLGFELVKATLAMGYSVIIHYHTDPQPALDYIDRHPELALRCTFIKSDLSVNPELLIDHAVLHHDRIIGLVNNASIFTPGNLTDIDDFSKTLQINALAPLKLANQFAKKAGTGWIINITDAHIRLPNRQFQNYRLSKLFLEEITRQQAFLFAPKIRVNAIAPGAMLPAKNSEERYFSSLKKQIPLRKTGDIRAFVRTYEFLIVNDYCTGVTIPVDGGWHLLG